MSLPTDPVDAHLPKGANFLAIVVGFAVAILIVLVLAWFFVGHGGKKTLPINTKSTPSQTLLNEPHAPWGFLTTDGLSIRNDA